MAAATQKAVVTLHYPLLMFSSTTMFNTTGEELFTYRGGCITQHYHTTNKIKHQNLSLVVSAFLRSMTWLYLRAGSLVSLDVNNNSSRALCGTQFTRCFIILRYRLLRQYVVQMTWLAPKWSIISSSETNCRWFCGMDKWRMLGYALGRMLEFWLAINNQWLWPKFSVTQ